MTETEQTRITTGTERNGARPPFHITKEKERHLRIQADQLSPALVIAQPSSFDEYARQLMAPGDHGPGPTLDGANHRSAADCLERHLTVRRRPALLHPRHRARRRP